MQLDTTTEEIWHFIGAFQQMAEAARGRKDFDAFRAQKAEAAQADLEFLNHTMTHTHRVPDFTPGVQMGSSSPNGPGLPVFPVAFYLLGPPQIDAPLAAQITPMAYLIPASGFVQLQQPFVFQLPAPSVAVIFAQQNIASDQDILIQQDLGLSFTPFSALDAGFYGLIGFAQSLDPLGNYAMPVDTPAIKAVAWQVAEGIATVTAGDHATVMRGPEVVGVHINGLTVTDLPDTELPALKDHLPDIPTPISILPAADLVEQVADESGPDPLHIAVMGGNTLVNEITLTVSWLDAPVMLAQGNALSISVISQINVLSQHVTTNSAQAAASQMFNIAEFANTARPLPEVPEDKAGIFPTSWLVTTMQADIINLNWMDQHNFLIDHDVASFTWSGATTFLRLGDNSLLNIGSILEIGFGYDLIVIGGDIINLNLIRQTNVLLDADWIATDDATMQVSAGGNLLWNAAAITSTGTDIYTPMSESGALVAADAAHGGSGAIPHAWQHPAFEGADMLNVLYISGDYLTVAMISQTNILGDADQVAALSAQTELATGGEAQIITGSNALVNLASINTVGMDSEIQVVGEVYSDALLYQASFIDTDAADPYAANGPAALSSEAVLFLADGMVTTDDAPGVPGGDITLTQGQLDGVNAVLA